MKKNKLKFIMTLSIFSLMLVIIFCLFIFKNPDSEQKYNINDKQAKVLEIENTKISNLLNSTNKDGVTTKIKNISTESIKNISIDYVELDKNKKEIATNKIPIKVTLNKNEKALVSIIPQDYTETIDIVGYSYNQNDYDIDVSLKEDKISIREKKQTNNNKGKTNTINDAEKYMVLDLSDLKQMDEHNYRLNIKNKSQKNIGNIILKVAEINLEDEYVNVREISSNSTLEAKESLKMILSGSKENSLEIFGYTYDDIENKINIDVDLKTKSASIVRN